MTIDKAELEKFQKHTLKFNDGTEVVVEDATDEQILAYRHQLLQDSMKITQDRQLELKQEQRSAYERSLGVGEAAPEPDPSELSWEELMESPLTFADGTQKLYKDATAEGSRAQGRRRRGRACCPQRAPQPP